LRLSRAGMLIVSHDRRFLEHTADDILELQAGAGEWYPGNYRQYLRLRRERRTVRQKEYEAQRDYIARTEEFIRRYKAGQRAREGRVKTGPRVTMRYYGQHLADLDPTKTVLTELQDAFGLPEETLRTFLGRLLFSGDDAFKTIRSLSGGEKSRVALAKLMLDNAGLLLLDEPTNHLDIPAQEMLEEALQDFEGTIVFVSHDRYFIDAIASRLW